MDVAQSAKLVTEGIDDLFGNSIRIDFFILTAVSFISYLGEIFV